VKSIRERIRSRCWSTVVGIVVIGIVVVDMTVPLDETLSVEI